MSNALSSAARPGSLPRWRRISRHWARTRRLWIGLFMLATAVLLLALARRVNWHEVMRALDALPAAALAQSLCLVPLAYLLYVSFDLLGRSYARHGLATGPVMTIAFISYAFNINLGSLIGGVGLRLRLYAKLGLRTSAVAKIVGISIFTSWLGYLWLTGTLFVLRWVPIPAGWEPGKSLLQAIGVLMLGACGGYLSLCAFARQRQWRVGRRRLTLPSLRLALLQSLLSVLWWSTMAAVAYVLFQGQIPYTTALSAVLLGAVAGVVVRIPGGLGVVEGTFVTLLTPALSQSQVLATILVYRAIYYLLPLAIAAPLYLVFETGRRHEHERRARG